MSETLRGSTPQSEFTLTISIDDEQECACHDCRNTPDEDLSLLVGCDVRGTAADYGTVGFCSLDCARNFVSEAPYQSLEADLIISTKQPTAAEIVHCGSVVETTLGFDVETAIDNASDVVTDLVVNHDASPDDISIQLTEL